MNFNKEEKVIRERISRIFRAARKLRAYKQSEISKAIGVVQATISKFESGLLLPDAIQWYRFCRFVEINTDLSYRTGLVLMLDKESSYDLSYFNLGHEVSSSEVNSKEFIPYLNTISKLGLDQKFEKYLKDLKIDKDIFYIVDLNLPFSLLGVLLKFIKKESKVKPVLTEVRHEFINTFKTYIDGSAKQTQKSIILSLNGLGNILRYKTINKKITIELNDSLLFSKKEQDLLEIFISYRSKQIVDICEAYLSVKKIKLSKKSNLNYEVELVS